MQENRYNKKQIEVVTGLEPSPCCALLQPSTIPLYEFVHSIPSCFSKCIITTIRLSRLSQNIRNLFCIRSSKSYWTFSFTCKPVTYKAGDYPLCPTIDILQLCKYHKHVLQCVGLGQQLPHYCLRFITLAQALRHPGLYTA